MTIRDRKTKSINFDTNRTFGVEMELTGYDRSLALDFLNNSTNITASRNDTNVELLAKYISAKTGYQVNRIGYYNNTRPTQGTSNNKKWDLKTDGSVNGMGLELVSHILKGTEGLVELRFICNALNQVNATVDRSSGLHVHHGRNRFPLSAEAQLMNLYNANAIAISSVIASSRVNSGYGGFNPMRDMANATDRAYNRMLENPNDPTGRTASISNSSRQAVNFAPRYTIEFRQHSGTTDYTKISNWIFLTQAFMNEAKRRVATKSVDKKNLASVSLPNRLLIDSRVIAWTKTTDNPNSTKVFNAFVRQSVRTMIKSLKLKYVTTSLYPTDDKMNGLASYLLNRTKELTIGNKNRNMSTATTDFARQLVGSDNSYFLVGQSQYNKDQVMKANNKASNIIDTVSSADWDGKVTKLYQ